MTEKKNKRKNRKLYHWSLNQTLKYLNFLKLNSGLWKLSLKERKAQGVMIQISHYLKKSKTPAQCRTHHQKMLARYGSMDNLI